MTTKLAPAFEQFKMKAVSVSVGAATLAVTSVSAFAVDPPAGVAITPEQLAPIVDGVSANLAVIIPVAIGLFAIMIGVALIPKVIKKFTS